MNQETAWQFVLWLAALHRLPEPQPDVGEDIPWCIACGNPMVNRRFWPKATPPPDHPNALIGTIVEAGTDESGQPRLLIHTEESDIKSLRELPLFRPALITIKGCEL